MRIFAWPQVQIDGKLGSSCKQWEVVKTDMSNHIEAYWLSHRGHYQYLYSMLQYDFWLVRIGVITGDCLSLHESSSLSQVAKFRRGVEKLESRQAHNLKVARSNRAPATKFSMHPSSSGQGSRPFTAVTPVRIRLGVPRSMSLWCNWQHNGLQNRCSEFEAQGRRQVSWGIV